MTSGLLPEECREEIRAGLLNAKETWIIFTEWGAPPEAMAVVEEQISVLKWVLGEDDHED